MARASSSRSSELIAPHRVQRTPAAPPSNQGPRRGSRVPRRVRARLTWLERYPLVAWARNVYAVYQAAGGNLLARGLVYSAIFALLPGLLLAAGVAGIVISDSARLNAIVNAITDQFPPIKQLVGDLLKNAVTGATSFSIVGLAGVMWGASRFYVGLDDAIARIFAGPVQRGLVVRSLLGFVSVFVLIGVLVLAFGVTTVAGVAQNILNTTPEGKIAWRVFSAALTASAMIAGVGFVYHWVPTPRPSWRAVVPPAVGAGIAIAVVTYTFGLLQTWLIGAAAIFGTVTAIYSTMVWLGIGFQILLFGAAWVRVRMSALAGRDNRP